MADSRIVISSIAHYKKSTRSVASPKPSPWREGLWTSPSFLWKEVPRRGGGWLPQRDETKCETARPPVSSSRAQPRDLSCRSGVRHACGCSENRSGAHLTLSVSPVCKGRFLASLEMTIRGRRYAHFPPLRRIAPLAFIPPVPYPPLRGTFPSRGRLMMREYHHLTWRRSRQHKFESRDD